MQSHPIRRALPLIATAALLALRASPAGASDPSRARYTTDPTKVFWFMQLTDTHIDSAIWTSAEARLQWALTTGVNSIDPSFVVVTGDITDSTTGYIYGLGPHAAEWTEYRGIVNGAGMTADFYYDIPGNHDAYGDASLSYYLANSVQGAALHTTQPAWSLAFPFGTYYFLGVATPANDGLQWPWDNVKISTAEYNELSANLAAHTTSNLTFALGHHDYLGADGGASVDDLFELHRVPYYLHGHSHDYNARKSGGNVIIQRVNSIGQDATNNICVWAVDNDAVSHRCVDNGSAWPLAVITAPVDARLDDSDDVPNPYAPSVPVTCASAPLRVLAFDGDAIVATVSYWFDTGLTGALAPTPGEQAQWTGRFDARGIAPGIHTLTVEVIGSATRDFEAQILFENRACDLPADPADDAGPEAVDAAEAVETAEGEPVAETLPDGDEDSAADTLPEPVDDVPTDTIAEQDTAAPDPVVDGTSEETEGEGSQGDVFTGDLGGGACACSVVL